MRVGQSHIASIAIDRDASTVFDFMRDPKQLSRWSFGTWQTEIQADGLVLGTGLVDGAKIYLRIQPHEVTRSVDYHIGPEPGSLVPRIQARVIPGGVLGLTDSSCVLSLIAWRSEQMDEARWRRMIVAHEMEIVLLKGLLESAQA